MSKRTKTAQAAAGPVLQHTRQGTRWPDIETCTESQDTLTVKKGQIADSKEYIITSRDEDGRISELQSNTGEEFWAAYNPALDRYYVRSKDPEKPFRTPQHMAGFRAFFDQKTKTLIWMVPRNGSCTVLASLMNAEGLEVKEEQPAMIWNCQGHAKYHFNVIENKLPDPEKWLAYKHCIVYQDPVFKCIRHMNYVLSCHQFLLHTFFTRDAESEENIQAFIDTYLAIAEINTHNTRDFYEQSMIPQMFYYKNIPAQIDSIVDIDKLDIFIERELKIRCKKANLENSLGLLMDDITEEHMKRIEKIYGKDKEIPVRFKDRLWK